MPSQPPQCSQSTSHTPTLLPPHARTHGIPSLLIKPMQRLLKSSLLLGTIVDAMPDALGDHAALVQMPSRMEEVARGANKQIKERHLKTLHRPKVKDLAGTGPSNAEAPEVTRLEGELQKYSAFLDRLAKDSITFGVALGLTPLSSALGPNLPPEDPNNVVTEVHLEAYNTFALLSTLPRLFKIFEENLNTSFIPILCDLHLQIK
ncbi:hypothetical protein HYDPIDRAFT_33905 [Hydnomerulius pinastri MD-312]|uniref:DH domain-containing protein n=1 Tax=Hydnomerulius pinastri MD-312 TaxID=994086 RepID=A0A0C9VZ61_9AGAM|nr:hypothetical protein HYDPIDRAFT_33905 [Hydnomerulius pinastri MD-312]